jgi:hypothetical protein
MQTVIRLDPRFPLPLAGEGGARAKRGRVRAPGTLLGCPPNALTPTLSRKRERETPVTVTRL